MKVIIQILGTEAVHHFQYGYQPLACFSQPIFHLWRHDRVNMPVDQPVLLQTSELLCQHFLSHFGKLLFNIAEPQIIVAQIPQYQYLPFARYYPLHQDHRAYIELDALPPHVASFMISGPSCHLIHPLYCNRYPCGYYDTYLIL